MKELWYLRGEWGDQSPWNIPLNREEYILGRKEDCDLVLNDGSISRKHCRIFKRRGEMWLVDLESRNGTFLNGSRLEEERPLRDGDILRLGSQEFQFCTEKEWSDPDRTIYDDGKNRSLNFQKFYLLSEREEEVFYLLLKGLSVKNIAEKLFISPGTAKNHVLKIYKKTETHSRIELATLYQKYESKRIGP